MRRERERSDESLTGGRFNTILALLILLFFFIMGIRWARAEQVEITGTAYLGETCRVFTMNALADTSFVILWGPDSTRLEEIQTIRSIPYDPIWRSGLDEWIDAEYGFFIFRIPDLRKYGWAVQLQMVDSDWRGWIHRGGPLQ